MLISLLTVRYLSWRVTDSLNLSTALSSGLSLVLLLPKAGCAHGSDRLGLAWKRFPDRREQMDVVDAGWPVVGAPRWTSTCPPAANRWPCWNAP